MIKINAQHMKGGRNSTSTDSNCCEIDVPRVAFADVEFVSVGPVAVVDDC